MINDQNSPAGGREIGEEELRHLEQTLAQSNPGLRYNPHLREMALAIARGSQANLRPSEAVRSDGQMHGSDINKENMQGFFGDMESFRKKEMSPESLGPTDDPEDDRHFGEERISPGQEWLRQMQTSESETEGQRPESEDPGLEAGQQRDPGARSLEIKAGAPAGQTPWLRRYPAAGRFGRTR